MIVAKFGLQSGCEASSIFGSNRLCADEFGGWDSTESGSKRVKPYSLAHLDESQRLASGTADEDHRLLVALGDFKRRRRIVVADGAENPITVENSDWPRWSGERPREIY
jgi:hypothetical protein